ncbi:MAG: flagellar hook-associated protein FlgK [Synergistaceae bacterium]|jgi:flagellar hook-associated protein 1 FlgK|nr:flagellar hook-associated protein FlgK [Synergistaceae bacterium]
MVSTYHGIETGRRANEYFKKGMEIAGINTSNMGKEGYSRQVVSRQASLGLISAVNVSYLGTGVEITAIERMRDLFLDAQYRRASVQQSYWNTMVTGTKRVMTFMANVNEREMNSIMDDFWTALQDIHVRPYEPSVRNPFLQMADTLTKYTNDLYSGYNSYRDELNKDVMYLVKDANDYIDQIALINKGIKEVRTAGGEVNTLLDQRDLLADKLTRLTGATVSTARDELDGDYKINLNGMLLVQGTNTRHLVLVKNPANSNYYDVQVEYNQYDITSNSAVAGAIVEQRSSDPATCPVNGAHELEVLRRADETYWTVGYGAGRIRINSPNEALGRDGSFALQVGSNGARVYSKGYPNGVFLETPGPGAAEEYTFRIAAGDFESTINIKWNSGTSQWDISDNKIPPNTASSAGSALLLSEIQDFIDSSCDGAISATLDPSGSSLILEGEDANGLPSGQLISITDMVGDLARTSGLANANPIVLIEVVPEDTLQTIANKINNAYKFDMTRRDEFGNPLYTTVPPETSPSSPEQWAHASVEQDADGNYFLCVTSNVAGEANRVNVLSGSACGVGTGEMGTAMRLGLVDDVYDIDPANLSATLLQANAASYIQLDGASGAVTTRYAGDVFVDDAYFLLDGKRYLSSSNSFLEARYIPENGIAKAEAFQEAIQGVRIFLNGDGERDRDTGELIPGSNITTILVRHHLTSGEIFANLKLRDDVILSQMDFFDDMVYKLATEFNATHYAGYGLGDYENITGMAFFSQITNKYGAFGQLAVDEAAFFDQSRIASQSGDGNGNPMGTGDWSNALELARLQQAKLFMGGMSSFNDMYLDFIAELGALGSRAMTSLETQDYILEQVNTQRESIMGVNSSEEMLHLVELNNDFNKSSQFISTLFQVIDQIISGVGRVGL